MPYFFTFCGTYTFYKMKLLQEMLASIFIAEDFVKSLFNEFFRGEYSLWKFDFYSLNDIYSALKYNLLTLYEN